MVEKIVLTIVIPFRIVDNQLEDSLDIIYSLSLDEFEVILVYNGIEELAEVRNRFKKGYLNFRLIKSKPNNVSLARNKGLKLSKGKFIYFVDSDDKIISEEFGYILNYLYTSEDNLVVFKYAVSSYNSNKSPNIKFKQYKNIRRLKNYNYNLSKLFFIDDLGIPVWNKIYKRNFLILNKLSFDQRLKFAEDFLFNIRVFITGTPITLINKFCYIYNESDDLNKPYYDKLILDYLDILLHELQVCFNSRQDYEYFVWLNTRRIMINVMRVYIKSNVDLSDLHFLSRFREFRSSYNQLLNFKNFNLINYFQIYSLKINLHYYYYLFKIKLNKEEL